MKTEVVKTHKMLYKWLNCVLFVMSWHTYVESNELQYVHLLIRHGDRSPTHLLPNDTNTPDTWPQGLGQLSQLGLTQGYKLGQYLRKRYIDNKKYLSQDYKISELYARSTDRSRTLMTGSAVLQGLYPTSKQLLWDPIPVHTRLRETDPMLFMDIPCERYTTEFIKLLQSPKVQAYLSKHTEFIEYVSKQAGFSNVSLQNVWDTYDPLSIELLNNRTIPSWVTPSVFKHIKELFWKKFEFYYGTQELRKMKAGLFLTEVYNHTKKTIDGKMDPDIKMNVYVAHDTTLASVLSSLGIWDKNIPPVGATIFFELYQLDNKQYAIKVLYKNDTKTDPFSDPYTVIMPDCKELCPVEKFYEKVEPYLMEDEDSWFIYCQQYPGSDITKGGIVAVSIFSCLFLIGLIVLFIWCYRNQQQEVRYRPANFSSEPPV